MSRILGRLVGLKYVYSVANLCWEFRYCRLEFQFQQTTLGGLVLRPFHPLALEGQLRSRILFERSFWQKQGHEGTGQLTKKMRSKQNKLERCVGDPEGKSSFLFYLWQSDFLILNHVLFLPFIYDCFYSIHTLIKQQRGTLSSEDCYRTYEIQEARTCSTFVL